MHKPDPVVRLSDAPPSPADALAKAASEDVLAKFIGADFSLVDSVQVIAYVRGKTLASWIAITPRQPRAKAVP